MSDATAGNPHSLGKQLLGLTIGSAILFFFGGILTVLTGVFTFCDAWVSGIYKKKDVKSVLNISPMGWGIVMEGLMLITYPVYLLNRNRLKTKGQNNVFWILTIIFGGLSLALAIIQIVAKLQGSA
jgi:hypothetical protein